MDLLSKISREHGQVYESLAVFEKISAFEQASEPFENMRDFFRDLLLPHFQFEEEHIFPVMLVKASEQEKRENLEFHLVPWSGVEFCAQNLDDFG